MTTPRLPRARTGAIFAVLPLVLAALTPKVAHAQDMDTCIAASEMALVQRKAGKLIDERASLAACASSACPEPVRASCAERLADLGGAVPSILFVTRDEGGHDLAAVRLTIDGVLDPAYVDGRALDLDPGEHIFEFDLAGHDRVVQHFVLHQNEQNRRETIVLPVSAPVPARAAPSGLGTQRIAGLTLGGVGLIGLGVGAIYGVLASSAWNDAKLACGGNASQCAPAGVSTANADHGTSTTDGMVATVGLIAGSAALAAGLVLFLTSPQNGHSDGRSARRIVLAPSLGAGSCGIALGGTIE